MFDKVLAEHMFLRFRPPRLWATLWKFNLTRTSTKKDIQTFISLSDMHASCLEAYSLVCSLNAQVAVRKPIYSAKTWKQEYIVPVGSRRLSTFRAQRLLIPYQATVKSKKTP